jgi:hypothetical protein
MSSRVASGFKSRHTSGPKTAKALASSATTPAKSCVATRDRSEGGRPRSTSSWSSFLTNWASERRRRARWTWSRQRLAARLTMIDDWKPPMNDAVLMMGVEGLPRRTGGVESGVLGGSSVAALLPKRREMPLSSLVTSRDVAVKAVGGGGGGAGWQRSSPFRTLASLPFLFDHYWLKRAF